MSFRKILIVSAFSVATLALTGCSGEPSSSDIEKAVKANIDQVNKQMQEMGGPLGNKMQTEVHEIKKIGCAKAEDNAGYNCDVEMDMTAPMIGRNKSVGKLRLVKGSDGWVVTQ
jgi:outer membrane murein-binding lipoprotein Lpp